ncbi:MAG: hypothetical protein OXC82_12090 [Rhodobacteraceae bacterium]|nr:hypothetical protein [Paracoccaceae bacterium]MCY4251158.1 hypothetical protein [Paracoccaceae bacterium]
MRLAKALNTLDMWCRRDRLVFTHNDLRKLFPEDSDVTFKAGLARLTATGVMKRVARGVTCTPWPGTKVPIYLNGLPLPFEGAITTISA